MTLKEKDLKNFAENAIARQAKAKEDAEKMQDLSKAEFKKVRMACRRVFSTVNGKIVARAMMRASGVYGLNKSNNNLIEIGKERGKEWMYLFFIKGMLDGGTIADIEKQIERKEIA